MQKLGNLQIGPALNNSVVPTITFIWRTCNRCMFVLKLRLSFIHCCGIGLVRKEWNVLYVFSWNWWWLMWIHCVWKMRSRNLKERGMWMYIFHCRFLFYLTLNLWRQIKKLQIGHKSCTPLLIISTHLYTPSSILLSIIKRKSRMKKNSQKLFKNKYLFDWNQARAILEL